MREAIKAGELPATKGKVRFGDVADWSGEELAVCPQEGLRVAVLPDSARVYVIAARASSDQAGFIVDQ